MKLKALFFLIVLILSAHSLYAQEVQESDSLVISQKVDHMISVYQKRIVLSEEQLNEFRSLHTKKLKLIVELRKVANDSPERNVLISNIKSVSKEIGGVFTPEQKADLKGASK